MNQNPEEIVGQKRDFPSRFDFMSQAIESVNRGMAPTYIDPNTIGLTPYWSPSPQNQSVAAIQVSFIQG